MDDTVLGCERQRTFDVRILRQRRPDIASVVL
jgi:hypothetical protein